MAAHQGFQRANEGPVDRKHERSSCQSASAPKTERCSTRVAVPSPERAEAWNHLSVPPVLEPEELSERPLRISLERKHRNRAATRLFLAIIAESFLAGKRE